ncbi:MAG: hypothetical protein AAGG01_16955 [Planctomycetota bacterium]
MLLTLAGALLAPSVSPEPSVHWLDRLAPNSAALLEVGDVATALKSPDPGAWLGLLESESMRGPLTDLLEAAFVPGDLEGAEGESLRAPSVEEIRGLLELVHGAAVAAPTLESERALAVISAEGGFPTRLLALAESMGCELGDAEVHGREARVITVHGSDVLTLMRHEAGALLAFGDRLAAESLLDHYADVIEGEVSVDRGWWRRSERRIQNPLVQVYMHLATIDDGGSEVNAAQYLDVASGGFSFGRAGEPAFAASIQAGPDEGLHDVLDAFGPVDRAFMKSVPDSAHSANYMNVDLGALILSVLEIARGLDESSAAMIGGMLGAGDAAVGASLIDEVFPALTGDFAFVFWKDMDDSVYEAPEYDPNQTSAIVGVQDAEVLLDTLEIVGELAGWESTDEGDVTSWSIGMVEGVELVLRLDDSRLIFGTPDQIAAVVAHVEQEASASLVTDEVLSKLGDWEWLSVANDAAALDAMFNGYANMKKMNGEAPSEELYGSFRRLFLEAMTALSSEGAGPPVVGVTLDPSGFFTEIVAR